MKTDIFMYQLCNAYCFLFVNKTYTFANDKGILSKCMVFR